MYYKKPIIQTNKKKKGSSQIDYSALNLESLAPYCLLFRKITIRLHKRIITTFLSLFILFFLLGIYFILFSPFFVLFCKIMFLVQFFFDLFQNREFLNQIITHTLIYKNKFIRLIRSELFVDCNLSFNLEIYT